MLAVMFYKDANYTPASHGPAQAGEVYLLNSTIKGNAGIPVGTRPGCYAGLSWRKGQWLPQPSDCMTGYNGVRSAQAGNNVHTVTPEAGVWSD